MKMELALADTTWFALKESKDTLPKPFERTIELGEYAVQGLVHLDNPGLRFRKLGVDGKLSLRKGMGDVCEIIAEGVVFGFLSAREGAVFNRLLAGGKRLVATPVEMSADGLEPEMRVVVKMEEF